MIRIRVFMNSSVEAVLSFKCCSMHDRNLEIHLTNLTGEPVTLAAGCELRDGRGEAPHRIDALFPAGPYRLLPGEPLACYGTLLDEIYDRYDWIVFRDDRGREHRAPLRQG